jgi:hypothetical protein
MSARDHFFIPFPEQPFYEGLNDLISLIPDTCRPPVQTLISNIKAVVQTVSIPFQMTATNVQRRRFQMLHAGERIRALNHQDSKGVVPEWAHNSALAKAHEKLSSELSSPDAVNRFAKEVLEDLSLEITDEEMRCAAAELLRQGVVLAWSALEVFARDIFVTLTNTKPSLALTLTSDEGCKRLFHVKGIPFEEMAQYNFNLSESMGSFLVSYHPVDSIPAMKTVFQAILPNGGEVNIALSESQLWLLFQRRHLIVHRRGIVDSAYVSNTGEDIRIGAQIAVSPVELEGYIKHVNSVGIAVAKGVIQALQNSPRSMQ